MYPQCHLNNGVSAELQRADRDVILGESAGRGNAAEEIAAKGAVDQGKENVAPKKRSHDKPQMELIIGGVDGTRTKRAHVEMQVPNNAMPAMTKKMKTGGRVGANAGVKGGKQKDAKRTGK